MVRRSLDFPRSALTTIYARGAPYAHRAVSSRTLVRHQRGESCRSLPDEGHEREALLLRPVLLLTLRGRKTDEVRTTPLLYYTEGDDVILVASNFGRKTHPAWYYNAVCASQVTLMSGGRSGVYAASEVTHEEERRRLFRGFEA